MSNDTPPDAFPCKLALSIPLPTPHLATTALRALSVDAELSPYVQRHFSIDPSSTTVLRVDYSATTNRMLRVAVNGFFESVRVVLDVMRELDVDVVDRPGTEGLEGVQGLEETRTS
ncbi:Pcc1-domain-containing protein [Lophiostoma macrostomum CBS 122681]|uniref:Pcc1-domain-containing protein n=1 Tax=Lophiostoma macrostomum CBS 122681 TaxID=1314788 RepID=A0A6A6SLI7_9PLEO|nr:Pcc1-domain-containing protein [Lophiostoma macrostomum CBS 122681]